MSTISINSVSRFLSFSWLTGPIFDKELRVSSRRKRNYTLRLIYVILLTFFITIVWLSMVKSEGSSAYQKSRLALAGKTIVSTIVTFQFIATQVIAVIMLSTSISDEIYHRTLGLLMTTPIGSFQIVMGKLFSKLLQIILLLAISLPMLAIVRIFGGVPWNYVLSSLCITLTAVIFAGSLSLHFSINDRRAYVVIIKTVVTLGSLYPDNNYRPFTPPVVFWHFVQESGNCASAIDRSSSRQSSRCNVCKYRDDDNAFCAKNDGNVGHYAERSLVLLLAHSLYVNVSCRGPGDCYFCQDRTQSGFAAGRRSD